MHCYLSAPVRLKSSVSGCIVGEAYLINLFSRNQAYRRIDTSEYQLFYSYLWWWPDREPSLLV